MGAFKRLVEETLVVDNYGMVHVPVAGLGLYETNTVGTVFAEPGVVLGTRPDSCLGGRCRL